MKHLTKILIVLTILTLITPEEFEISRSKVNGKQQAWLKIDKGQISKQILGQDGIIIEEEGPARIKNIKFTIPKVNYNLLAEKRLRVIFNSGVKPFVFLIKVVKLKSLLFHIYATYIFKEEGLMLSEFKEEQHQNTAATMKSKLFILKVLEGTKLNYLSSLVKDVLLKVKVLGGFPGHSSREKREKELKVNNVADLFKELTFQIYSTDMMLENKIIKGLNSHKIDYELKWKLNNLAEKKTLLTV
jgi:hypothetical protein